MVDKTVIIAGTSTTIVKKVVVGPPVRSIIQAAGRLATLSDVNITGVSDGNLLAYDSATAKWVASNALPPVNVVTGTYGSATQIPQLTILSDGRIDSAGLISVATNLNISGDIGTDAVSLLSDTLNFNGGNGLVSLVNNNIVTFRLDSDISVNTITTTGDVTVGGNFTVSGTTVTINTESLTVKDNIIYLNSEDSAGSPVVSLDFGWIAGRNEGSGYAHTGLFRDATDGTFKVFDNYIPEPSDDLEISTTDPSFSLSPFAASTFTGRYLGFDSDVVTKFTTQDSALAWSFDGTYHQIRVENATYTQKGVAFFNNTQFSVISGGVEIIDIDGGEY